MRYMMLVAAFLLCTLINAASAQEVKIKSFSTQMEPMTVPMQRTDNNGEVCALVKVIIPTSRATFEGSLIGECDYKTAEYWCYLSPGSKRLKIKIPDFEPLMVKFDSIIGSGVKSKQVYELVVSISKLSVQEITDSIISRNRIEELMRNLMQSGPDGIAHRRGRLFPYEKNGKIGFLNSDLEQCILPQYDLLSNGVWSVDDNDNSVDIYYHWVMKDGLWGSVDSDGNIVASFKYTKIYEPSEGLSYARIVLATDSAGQSFILNRVTGEVIERIPQWDFVKDGRFLGQPTSLLNFTDIKKHKDCFYDKVSGQRRYPKIPKGYSFKNFLPFNHLLFQKNKSLQQIILDSEGKLITENLFIKNVYGDEDHMVSPQFLFGNLGVFDLERERYIYNGCATTEYFAISSDVLQIKEGVHTEYLELSTGDIKKELPLIEPDKFIASEIKSIKNIACHIIKERPLSVVPIDKNIYLVKFEDHTLIIDRYGTFINEIFEVSSVNEKWGLNTDDFSVR